MTTLRKKRTPRHAYSGAAIAAAIAAAVAVPTLLVVAAPPAGAQGLGSRRPTSSLDKSKTTSSSSSSTTSRDNNKDSRDSGRSDSSRNDGSGSRFDRSDNNRFGGSSRPSDYFTGGNRDQQSRTPLHSSTAPSSAPNFGAREPGRETPRPSFGGFSNGSGGNSSNNPPIFSLPRPSDPPRGSLPGAFGQGSTSASMKTPARGALPAKPREQGPGGIITVLPPKPSTSTTYRPSLPGSLPRRTGSKAGDYDNGGYHSHTYYPGGFYGGYQGGLDRYPYGVPSASTTIIVPGNGDTFVFGAYHNSTTYAPGVTVYSPYWYYNCPTFLRHNYVITAPYLYRSGRETYPFRPYDDEDRYFNNDVTRGRGLRAALNDLARFWEENDTRALRRRVSPDFAVGVFENEVDQDGKVRERYTYALKRGDFLALSADALERVSTLSFRFNSVRDRTDGLVNAYATHVFRVVGEQTPRTATVRYTLVYVDGDWYVSAIAHVPAALAR